tara:strand:+ start:234 stop:935 length:702 start_codon:yes stop_codon:yes gene_type:complete
MANEHKIDVNKREYIGKKLLKQLRKKGEIPGIYYSATSKESISISIADSEFHSAIKSGARIFNISVGGKKQNVLFKSIQYHPVTDEVLHIDLYGINMNKPINIKVFVKLIGNPIGVSEDGGVLNQPINEIEIQCLPADIPDFVEADISELALGDSLNVGNINLDDKLTLVTSEDSVLASITHAMKEVEPVTAIDEDETFLDDEDATGDQDKDETKDDQTTSSEEKGSEGGDSK